MNLRGILIRSLCVITAICLWLVLPALVQADNEQQDEGKRWDRLAEAVKKTPQPKTVRARFEMTRTSLLLTEPITSAGRFVASGDVCRWSLGKPESVEVRIDAKQMKIYYTDDKLLEVYPIPEQGLPLASRRPDLDQLKKDFRLRSLAEADGVMDIELEARGGMREHLISMSLSFNLESGAMTRVATTDPAGDQTTMTLSDLETDKKVGEDELKLEIPEDARVVHPAGKG